MTAPDGPPEVVLHAGLASAAAHPPEIGQDHDRENPAGEE